MGATGTTNVINSYTNAFSTGTGGTLTDAFSDSASYSFGNGTGANQFDLPWSHANTLTNAADTFTLSALAGPGAGTTVLARAKKIWVHNLATAEGNTIVLAPGGTHPFTAAFGSGGITIPAMGSVCIVAPLATGYVVGSGSADQITVTATGTVPYKIEVSGCSA